MFKVFSHHFPVATFLRKLKTVKLMTKDFILLFFS